MKNLLVLLIVFSGNAVFAQSLSTSILPAGKTILGKIVDVSSNDITSQYTLSYPGTELKITTFAGKAVLVGSIVGNWNIVATKKSDSSVMNLPVTVTSGAPANLTILDGNSQSTLANTSFTNPIRVKVTDSFGNTIANEPVSFSVTTGSAKLSGSTTATVNTDTNGIASTTVTAGSIAERELISATLTSASKTVSFAENTKTPPNQAARIAITSQSSTAIVGQALSLTAQALDSTGILAPNYTGVVTVSSYKNNGCTIPSTTSIQGTLTATSSGGVVTFSSIQPQVIEPLYLKISAAGLPLICSQGISVVAPVAGVSSLKFTQLPSLLNSNQNLFPAIKVAELDNNGNLVSNGTDPITITSYDDESCNQQSAAQLTNNSGSAISGYATFARSQSLSAKTIYLKASFGTKVSQCSSALAVVLAANATPTPSATPLSCLNSQHIENNSCVSNNKSCVVANGSGNQTWNGTSYGACTVSSCLTSYHNESNACLSDNQTCTGQNGSGQKTWNGTSYSTCTLLTCDSNFQIVGNSCLADCSVGQSRNPNTEACYNNLNATIASASVQTDQTDQITATGGVPPYVYQVLANGVGSVTTNGLFSSSVVGSSSIKVQDSIGNNVAVSATVTAALDGAPDLTYGVNGSSQSITLPFYNNFLPVSTTTNNQGETFYLGLDLQGSGLDVVKIAADGISSSVATNIATYSSSFKITSDTAGNVYVAEAVSDGFAGTNIQIFKIKRSDLTIDQDFGSPIVSSGYDTVGDLTIDSNGFLIAALYSSMNPGTVAVEIVNPDGIYANQSAFSIQANNGSQSPSMSIALNASIAAVTVSSMDNNTMQPTVTIAEFDLANMELNVTPGNTLVHNAQLKSFGTSGITVITTPSYDSNNTDPNYIGPPYQLQMNGALSTQLDSSGNLTILASMYSQSKNNGVIVSDNGLGVWKVDSIGSPIGVPVISSYGSSLSQLNSVASAVIGGKLLAMIGDINTYQLPEVLNPGLIRLTSSFDPDPTFSGPQTSHILSSDGIAISGTNLKIAPDGSIYLSGYFKRAGADIAFISKYKSKIPGAPAIINTPDLLKFGQSVTLTAVGGVPPYSFSKVSGGGSIDATSGLFTSGGLAGFVTVKVTDSVGASSSVMFSYHSFELTPTSLVIAENGSATFATIGAPIGAVSLRLKNNSSNGTVSGLTYTAGSSGTYLNWNTQTQMNVYDTIEATDAAGNTFDLIVQVMPILSVDQLYITSADPTSKTANVSYSVSEAATQQIPGNPTDIKVSPGVSDCSTGGWVAFDPAQRGSLIVPFTDGTALFTVSMMVRDQWGNSNCYSLQYTPANYFP